MPHFCAVANCGSTSNRDRVSFFRFPSLYDNNKRVDPRKERRRKAWILATRRTDLTERKLKNELICSKHFLQGKPAKLDDETHPDWIPNQHMGYDRKTGDTMERYNRKKRRAECDVSNVAVEEHNVTSTNSPPVLDENRDGNDGDGVVQVTQHDLNYALANANEEIYLLRDRVAAYNLDMSDFQVNEQKCKFYTGLPFSAFKAVFELIEPYITTTHSTNLSKSQQLILTLMKLRLNLLFTDLGYRFNVSRTTCSRCFKKVLHILYMKLKSFIHWPERECLQSTMPACFQENFGKKVTVIIDCFEIFTESPTNKQASASHFSHYKHHNTVKYLIGISPQGSIMFISKGYTGRCSDKFVTENSDFLKNLLPGDVVLADRGFLINESVKFYMAEVQTPAFLKGKKQLHPCDIETTRKIANVRIHVERVIGALRQKYKITSDVLPIFMLRSKHNGVVMIDKILTVCSACINLCPSVVST